MPRTKYYWESNEHHGEFYANSDKNAVKVAPQDSIVIYKENDTPDGTPFIILYECKEADNADK